MDMSDEVRPSLVDRPTPNTDVEASKHESYTMTAFAKMNMFRKRGQLCDVVIRVGGREFLAHRVVLAATSDYFDAMFSNGMAESAQLEVELKSISPDIMDALLDYVYTGQVHVTMENVQDLLPAASLVQMEGVKTACSNFLVAEVDASNVLGIRRFAELHSCTELERFATNYAAHNFQLVVDYEEFLCLNHEELLDLISREDLRIDLEESVYDAVMRWVYHQVRERSPHLPALLLHVRLPVMSVRYLTDVVDNDDLIRQSLECRDLVDDAKRYHLRPDLRHEMRDRRFRQRDSGDEYIVVIGGFGSDQNPTDSVEMFNPRTSEWCDLPDLPVSYRYVAACSLDTCVYVIGGFDGQDRLSTACVLDLAHRDEGWRWLTSMHFKRGLSAACTHKGLIYACGGFDGESRLRSMEVYHPKIDEWRILQDMNTPREGAGLVVADDTFYCLGGYDGFQLLNSMEAYDLTRGTWRMCKPMYMRRSGAGCALLGDTLYVCGGYGGAEGRGSSHLDTVEAYNTRLQQWTLVTRMNVARCYVGACSLAGKIYVAAGYNGNRLLDTVESYDPVENEWWLHDDSPMNHERCDTGMCVVRFLSCAESPMPAHTAPVRNAPTSVSSAAAPSVPGRDLTTVSTSTGQLMNIRPPIESGNARHNVISGPSSGQSDLSILARSGAYPNRLFTTTGVRNLPGQAVGRIGLHSVPTVSLSSSLAYNGSFRNVPASSFCRQPHLSSRRQLSLMANSPVRGGDPCSITTLAVAGVSQGSLNRWTAHLPGSQTFGIARLSESRWDPSPSSAAQLSYRAASVVCTGPLMSDLVHSASDESRDPFVNTGHFDLMDHRTSDLFQSTSGDSCLPGILRDTTAAATSAPLDSPSSRASSPHSPNLSHRLYHSAPENELRHSIDTGLFSSADRIHCGSSHRERYNVRPFEAYPELPQEDEDLEQDPEGDPTARFFTASPDYFSKLSLLANLFVSDDEGDPVAADEVSAESDGVVDSAPTNTDQAAAVTSQAETSCSMKPCATPSNITHSSAIFQRQEFEPSLAGRDCFYSRSNPTTCGQQSDTASTLGYPNWTKPSASTGNRVRRPSAFRGTPVPSHSPSLDQFGAHSSESGVESGTPTIVSPVNPDPTAIVSSHPESLGTHLDLTTQEITHVVHPQSSTSIPVPGDSTVASTSELPDRSDPRSDGEGEEDGADVSAGPRNPAVGQIDEDEP